MLVPGRFTTTSIKTPDGGELEIRLTDGGHWQMKAKLVAEKDWRPLCRGHIDGSIAPVFRIRKSFRNRATMSSWLALPRKNASIMGLSGATDRRDPQT